MWQTPESAPKDGTPLVWLSKDGCGAYIYFWLDGYWWAANEDNDGSEELPYGTEYPSEWWAYMPPAATYEAGRRLADQYYFITRQARLRSRSSAATAPEEA